jgi:hypothetical protein
MGDVGRDVEFAEHQAACTDDFYVTYLHDHLTESTRRELAEPGASVSK